MSAPPQQQPLSDNLCWLLSRASWTLTTELTAAMEDLGLSPRAHSVLAAAVTGEHTQTELAQMVGLDKTTMVVTMDELEAKGLAERRPSPSDRRARVNAVSEAGKRTAAKADAVIEDVQTNVLESLPARDRKHFLEALAQLVCGRLGDPAACKSRPRRRSPR